MYDPFTSLCTLRLELQLRGCQTPLQLPVVPRRKDPKLAEVTLQAMKTVEKKGLQAMAKEAGLDLYSLPYTDARPQRLEWLAQQPINPPMVSHLPMCGLPLGLS